MLSVLRVALPVPLPTVFDYGPGAAGLGAHPEQWIGCRVRVGFGRLRKVGVVVGWGEPLSDPKRIRSIDARIDAAPLLDAELINLLRFAADYYLHPLGETVATALPAPLRGDAPAVLGGERWYAKGSSEELPRGSLARKLVDAVAGGPRSRIDLLALGSSAAIAIERLVERGYLIAIEAPPRSPRPTLAPPPATAEQRAALDALAALAPGFHAVLLDGVTGSGKTEVYIDRIAAVIAQGRQALVLVPEIGLTPQALRRYRERLGVEVLALHSGLADGERAQAWLAARAGRAPVIIGTRSAIFTPLPNAGLIVVDEEHDGSYKQQDGLRYHARDLALWRGRALGVPVLLGSATPSLETLARVADGRCARLVLSERVGSARMPAVHVEDLRRRRLTEGLSPALIDAIGATVARGEQVLVFRNRRGYAPAWLCHACGHVASCSSCDRPMTVHREANELRCHHCDRQQRLPNACPECKADDPVPIGVGTERLAEFLTGRFPEVPVLRIDRDSTRRKDSLATMLAEVERRPGAAILVGTQMLAKGHDLPNLTLAAIINVDGGLVSGDFRAPERLAQLLVQVAGRAGRAHKAGQVWLETHEPTHPVLRRLLDRGYAAFAATELAERREVALPPHAHWALLRAEALESAAAEAFLAAAARAFGDAEGVGVRGPMPAPMPRRSGRARWQLLFEAAERAPLRAALRRALPEWYALVEARRVRWSLDVDPVDLT